MVEADEVMTRRKNPCGARSLCLALVASVAAALPAIAADARPPVAVTSAVWQQLAPALSFLMAVERERYTTLDRSARIVLAVEAGKGGPKLDALTVNCSVRAGDRTVLQEQAKIEKGLLCLDVGIAALAPGRYDVAAQLMNGPQKLAEEKGFFRIEKVDPPAQTGRVALLLPGGMPLKDATWPVHAGVPFPKGALWSADRVRLVDAAGNALPCGLTVRSRWGSGEASIRWLGVDFQASAAGPWWPGRGAPQYFLEFGPNVRPEPARVKVTALPTPEGIAIDTGAISFLVRRQGFNLIDDVKLGGRALLKSDATHGLYLVDHQGATYRAANDAAVKLSIEEQTDLRVVVRAEGWYVRDGSPGASQSYTLPTDKLCRFITRIEAFAGKPHVRVLSTWVNTFDNFTVRLRDMGLSLPFAAQRATFGIEGKDPLAAPVPAGGVRLVQHLHDRFVIEDGAGKSLLDGERSAGWVVVDGRQAAVGVSHRDTWQRFPKEIEVLPESLRLHVWPAHGKDHPEIDIFAKDQIHRLWYAHQGRELDLAMPWNYYFAVAEYSPLDNYGVAAPHAFVGVQASAMGTAVTSDLLLHFAAPEEGRTLAPAAECFQAAPHALPDPRWTCDSLAMGYIHPYDPQNFRGFEEIISDGMRGYWSTQNAGKMFGMWIYRSWHHSAYNGDGSWVHYRMFNGTHHGEAIMPWVFYARSGDPFYLIQGRANIRQLSDVQIVHHADAACEQRNGVSASQGKLVGATKHDNCVAPWGGDHEVFGHQTCYNGLILGHYLTGDLRLREVLVEEWQNTITTGRDLPAIQSPYGDCASALAQGRDNSNPVSDLVDLYQLTYDPRVLAVLKPRLDIFLYGPPGKGTSSLFTAWGHALHNIILFHGMEDVRQSLLKVMADKRAGAAPAPAAGAATPRGPGRVWNTIEDYRAQEAYAMATILDPESPYAADVMFGWGHGRASTQQLARVEPLVLSQFADILRPIPRMMYALMHSTRRDLAGVLGDAQPMPITWTGAPLHCVVREDADQEIKLHIYGQVNQPKGMEVQVFAPDGALVSRSVVPPGRHSAFVITLPKDGKTGEYVLFVKRARQGQSDDLSLPLTTLPEVYLVREWVTGGDRHGPRPAQYFTRSPGPEPCDIEIAGERTRVFAPDKRKLLGFTNKDKKSDTVRVGPDGVWMWGFGAPVINSYAADKTPAVLSTAPERWFLPAAPSLSRKPAP
jgi:hypothetical protein